MKKTRGGGERTVAEYHRIFQRLIFPFGCSVIAVVFASASIFAAESVVTSSASPLPRDSPLSISGSLSTKYLYRSAAGSDARASDQDVHGDLRFDITRPEDNRYEIHFFGAGRSDLDGNQSANTFYPFKDSRDTYNSSSVSTIYEANFALNEPLQNLTKLRVGRQSGGRDEPVFFDGLSAELGGEKLNFSLYGGAAIHFFEPGTHWGEDTLEGAGVDYTPLRSLGVSFDYLLVKDRTKYDPPARTLHDRMVALKVWQRFEPFIRISEKYRLLNGAPRDFSVQAAAASQEADAELLVSYFRQFRIQNELTNEFSPFSIIMGQSAPYQSYDIKIRKVILDRVATGLGYYKRALLDAADSGPFNKEYDRAFLDAEVSDILTAGLSATIIADKWKGQDTSYNALGYDLSYRIKRKTYKETKVSIGAYSSLYKYDYYLDLGVRERVRTYYLTGKYPLTGAFSMNGGYEDERGLERYQTLRMGMRYDF